MARIEDHALIGDCHSAALVCRDGTIDWLCLPRFDSPACFASLLGTRDNGQWRIAPSGPVSHTTRRYRDDTLILETEFETVDGTVALIDFMSVTSVIRIVEGRSGAVACRCDLVPRFDYGATVPEMSELAEGGAICVGTGPDRQLVRANPPLRIENRSIVADFTVHAGERIRFSLSHAETHLAPSTDEELDAVLTEQEATWRAWSAHSIDRGRWRDPVRRSLLTLKALTHRPTGGMVAAPTTSLPEWIGGRRNWDYRCCWPRDTSFALLAMVNSGQTGEVASWVDWLDRALGGTPSQLQSLYGVAGERWVAEREITLLPGYESSTPVRAGNAAMTQYQLDIFGEIELLLHRALELGVAPPDRHWAMRVALIEHLETEWREPDEGIWEVRGGAQHFTFSKAMAWVALDRAIHSAEAHTLPAPLDRWRGVRTEIFNTVCKRGFNASIGAFTQTLDGATLDASLLLLPLIGFLPPNDPRVAGTVTAIGRELMTDGLIKRYHTHETADGLPAGEGVFLACSFWYASNLALQGRHDEATALFERLLGLCNDVGLLSEEYDPVARRQLGNFPQAFSHLALLGTALVLDGVATTL